MKCKMLGSGGTKPQNYSLGGTIKFIPGPAFALQFAAYNAQRIWND